MMSVSEMISQGLNYMGIGVGVVFVVLAVFFGVIKLLMKIWPPKES
jgi:Na+-transporting methylmalonyl-CoA/oxaloacetate decarboxylase gamma subunit